MPDSKVIGKRIRLLRGNIPRKTICAVCGVGLSSMSMYECGQRVPSDKIKVKLAGFFGKSVQEIFFTD